MSEDSPSHYMFLFISSHLAGPVPMALDFFLHCKWAPCMQAILHCIQGWSPAVGHHLARDSLFLGERKRVGERQSQRHRKQQEDELPSSSCTRPLWNSTDAGTAMARRCHWDLTAHLCRVSTTLLTENKTVPRHVASCSPKVIAGGETPEIKSELIH